MQSARILHKRTLINRKFSAKHETWRDENDIGMLLLFIYQVDMDS